MQETKKRAASVKQEPAPPGTVWCRRLLRPLPIAQHRRCSYCYGSEADIGKGDHAAFCDFDPKRDPINFGFPEGGGWVEE